MWNTAPVPLSLRSLSLFLSACALIACVCLLAQIKAKFDREVEELRKADKELKQLRKEMKGLLKGMRHM